MNQNGTNYENMQPATGQTPFQEAPVYQEAPVADAAMYGAPVAPAVEDVAPKPKKKKSKLLIISIILNIVLFLGAIASVVFLYVIPKINEGKEEDVAVEPGEGAFFANELVLAGEDGKYGYMDSNGEWVIEPQFDDAYDFSDNGLAAVCEDYEWGFIDTNGDYVIKPQYDGVDSFCFGVARVENFDDEVEYAIIDEEGNYVVDFGKYDYIGYFNDETEYCQVEKGTRSGIINTAGEEVVAFGEYEYICEVYKDGFVFAEDKKLGFADFEGNVLLEPEFEGLGWYNSTEWCAEDGCYEYSYYDEYCHEHSDLPYCSYSGCYNRVEYADEEYCYEHSYMEDSEY